MSTNVDRKKSQRAFLKERVLHIYEKLFQGEDVTQRGAEFWEEFFLLRPNLKWLNAHFEKLAPADLILLQPHLHRLLVQCLHMAQHGKHHIRVSNAIQTMDALVTGVHRYKPPLDGGKNTSGVLLNTGEVGEFMQRYTSLCLDMFLNDRPESLRCLILNSMHSFAAAVSNSIFSSFAMGLMNAKLVECLRLILVNSRLRHPHGLAACKLLGLLIQICGQNEDSSFSLCQSIMDDELFLNGVTSTVSLALSEYNARFYKQCDSSGGLFSSVSSLFGGLFTGDMASNVSSRPCDSLLMCMYAIAKNGTHFSTILSYSTAHQTTNGFDVRSPGESSKKDPRQHFSDPAVSYAPQLQNTTNVIGPCDNDSRPSLFNASTSDIVPSRSDKTICKKPDCPDLVERSVCEMRSSGLLSDFAPTSESSMSHSFNVSLEPRNLLADLLEYCSIVMQNVKATESINSCHLCLVIVLCITQNPMACSILHDSHVTLKVCIHKYRSRYHKHGLNSCSNCSGRPVAVGILSLAVEFIRGHLMKKLPYRSYSIVCSISRNLLCYQVKHEIRLDFDWKQFWSGLLNLLQFILKLDQNSLSLDHSFRLILQILDLFNLFILYGDRFLQAAHFYDDLYYEIIRMRSLFDSVYENALLHLPGSHLDLRTIVSDVILHMGNIRSITNHFAARIAAFSASNNLASLTEDQVLNVVRDNYESLNLRVYEGLSAPDEYNEKLDQPLFASLLETSLRQVRGTYLDTCLEAQSLYDLSTIS